jgi:tetratricopeptide (TPR) repeat protein/mono/diheme cytochrome c family protein
MHHSGRALVAFGLAVVLAGDLADELTVRAGGQSTSDSTASSGVTFTKDVAPVVYERCVGCHRPGGGAPFDLLTYDDVRRRASQIAAVTASRSMPPWKPEPGFGDFAGDRRLSDAQIATIRRWVDQGAVEGAAVDLPARPTLPDGWLLGTPDLVVTMPVPYLLPPGGGDAFRTFVVPIPVRRGRYVAGIEFRPGNAHAVHHANLKFDSTRSSRRLDESDPTPGFDGGAGRDATFPNGHFLGWTPGQRWQLSDEGGWRLDPNTDLVLEMHMMRMATPEPVQASVAFFLTDRPPSRVPSVLRLGRQSIDIPAGEPAHVVTDEYVLPVPVDVLSVQPHAHNLAIDVKGWAELPDGSTRPLVWIKQWDFNWQDVYRYAAPVSLPRGTTLRMRYVYDNSAGNPRNPHRPPRRVTFGQTTSSEMGDLWLQVITRSEGDRAALDADYLPKMLREDIAGVQKMLESTPDDARLHADLAFCYIAAGRVADAIAHLRDALRLDPASANAHYDLGTTLLRERRLDEAEAMFMKAVQLRRGFSEAHNNLGVVRFLQGKSDAAMRSYEQALSLQPDNAEAHYNLGRVRADRQQFTAAIGDFRRSLEVRPSNAEAYAGLASAQAAVGRTGEAIDNYRRSLEIKPDLLAGLVDLAWLLATAEPGRRNPPEALRLAQRAARLTGSANATTLDTLALAYFASGQLQDAISTQQTAVNMASERESVQTRQRLRQRLDFYLAQRAAFAAPAETGSPASPPGITAPTR